MRRKAGETFLGKKKREIGILRQVAAFFLIAVLIIGIVTFFMLRVQSIDNVRNQTELLAEETANEVIMSVREYPAHEWFLRYWYRHADELDVEYDTDYSAGTKTEEKLQLVRRHHPELSLKYAEAQELEALPEEDQKLCAEIVYSWMITRVNQIKRAYQVDYLFCVVADEAYQSQCFLFSAADEGAVRGTNYEEVYVLGTSVSIADNQSQQDAMRQALEHSTHLAEAGDYVDYYAYLGDVDTKAAFIGLTFNLSGLLADVQAQTWIGTGNAVILELLLAAFCLLLIYFYVLRPLKHVQQGIRTYKITKDSKAPEAAWQFISFMESCDFEGNGWSLAGFPLTEKSFYELADKSRFDGKKQFPEQEGNGYAWNNGEKTIGLGPLTDEDIQFIYDCIINAEVPPKTFDVYDKKYYNIIDEERNALYAGEQTPEQTAKYLQDRIGTFLSENY